MSWKVKIMRTFDYIISEKPFLEVWQQFGCPTEITNTELIIDFLNTLVEKTEGQFIVDHISSGDFDCVNSISYTEPFFKIQWKDFDKFRIKFLNNELNDFDNLTWSTFGCATFDYILCSIKKVNIIDYHNHLFICLQLNIIETNYFEKWLKNNNLTTKFTDDTTIFEREYILLEGDESELKKHICHLNSLPFYTILIQPKENSLRAYQSRKILTLLNYNNILNRLNNSLCKLNKSSNLDEDSLFEIANGCRRIYENFLKYFCVYDEIEMKNIKDKYKHIKLGDLRKLINKKYNGMIQKSLINQLNEFSHDSGLTPTKNEIKQIILDVTESVKEMYEKIK